MEAVGIIMTYGNTIVSHKENIRTGATKGIIFLFESFTY